MSLKPTSVPLTIKEFEEAKCGVCGGCGCSCGYIAYLKGGSLIDLYGHPQDPNGVGSFCTKGIALIQEAPKNPLRVSKPLIRKGDKFIPADAEGIFEWIRKNIKGRIGVFLDRHTDLMDYSAARELTDNVFSTSIYLPFRASTLRPQAWREQKVILSLECEPVFSDVMATRWLVDAFERSAYIVAVSSRYETNSAKASKRYTLKPPLVVRFLEELLMVAEGVQGELLFEEEAKKLSKLFSVVKESLILVGESLIRSPWKGNVLGAVKKLREKFKVNYAVVGDVSPLEMKGVGEFLEEVGELDSLIITGNPALYMPEDTLNILKDRPVLHLAHFPNLTAHVSSALLPAKFFAEREFINFRNGFGFIHYSQNTLTPPEHTYSLWEVLEKTFGTSPKVEGLLEKLGVRLQKLKNTLFGEDIELPTIEEVQISFYTAELPQEGMFLFCDNTLVDEVGHWNVWTHDIEKEQFAYLNEGTAQKLSLEDYVELGGERLRLRINNNIAEDVIFVPNSYEETQPFHPGIRPGRLMKNPSYRVDMLR